jgi:prophage regulatory protein
MIGRNRSRIFKSDNGQNHLRTVHDIRGNSAEEINQMQNKPPDALVRISQIIGPRGLIPVSRSAFYQGVRDGIYPKPVRLGKRTSAWRMSELMKIIEKGAR